MNTPKHSPLPWSVEENAQAGGLNHLAITNRSNGKEWMMASITPMSKVRDIDYANAEFIVRAVNSHDELVAALLGLVTLIRTSRVDDGSTWTEDDARAFANAEEALKKAGAL